MDQLIEQLAKLATQDHYYCEDYYYACPQSNSIPDYLKTNDVCNCGADDHNALVKSLLEQIKNANV